MRQLLRRSAEYLQRPAVVKTLVGWLIILSIVEWVAAHIFGWVRAVSYVSDLSQLAITISLIPWYQGLKVETHQVEEDIPNEVVEKLVEATNLEPAD